MRYNLTLDDHLGQTLEILANSMRNTTPADLIRYAVGNYFGENGIHNEIKILTCKLNHFKALGPFDGQYHVCQVDYGYYNFSVEKQVMCQSELNDFCFDVKGSELIMKDKKKFVCMKLSGLYNKFIIAAIPDGPPRLEDNKSKIFDILNSGKIVDGTVVDFLFTQSGKLA